MMPTLIDPARARDVIDAYGAAPERWPADERDAVLAHCRADPALEQARVGAAQLDTLLDHWATARPAGPASRARVVAYAVADLDHQRTPRAPWLAGGGLIAAAAAGLALWMAPADHPALPHKPPATVARPAADTEAFRMLFTPTTEEEDYL